MMMTYFLWYAAFFFGLRCLFAFGYLVIGKYPRWRTSDKADDVIALLSSLGAVAWAVLLLTGSNR
jgi:hypothetical protein